MLTIDENGHISNVKIKLRISALIERESMEKAGDAFIINGIIVHQTGAATAQSTFNSYGIAKANGAHFLIDKDGTIYQTASIYKRTNHVGKLKARCLLESKCSPIEIKALKTFNPTAENNREKAKAHPHRFPGNADSIGIELVGRAFADTKDSKKIVYETVTDQQNASLKWLVEELRQTLGISLTEVFRHPIVSRKNETEAATAIWE